MNNICGYKTKTLCKGGTLREAAQAVVNSLHEADRLREQEIQSSKLPFYQIPNIHGVDVESIIKECIRSEK